MLVKTCKADTRAFMIWFLLEPTIVKNLLWIITRGDSHWKNTFTTGRKIAKLHWVLGWQFLGTREVLKFLRSQFYLKKKNGDYNSFLGVFWRSVRMQSITYSHRQKDIICLYDEEWNVYCQRSVTDMCAINAYFSTYSL